MDVRAADRDTEWDSGQIMSTRLGTTMRESTNPLSSTVRAKSENTGRGGCIGLLCPKGDLSVFRRRWEHPEGQQFPVHQQMWLFGKIQISICFWFVFKEKSAVSFQLQPAMDHGIRELTTLLQPGQRSGEVYLKMKDRDRIVPSLWSSCFLIWDNFQRSILIHSSASTPVFAQR